MSLKTRLRMIAASMLLAWGLLVGLPMRPEEIEAFLASIRKPQVAHTLRQQQDSGADP